MTQDVVIVGGGLAGLDCALQLERRGAGFVLVEASDVVGGRIRTDVVDGFRLDRGFQVFLMSYTEAKRLCGYESLQRRPFLPGAFVRHAGKSHLLADPWRRPFAAMRSLFSPTPVLNGERPGPIVNLRVPTLFAPSYGPGDASQVSVTVLAIRQDTERVLADVCQRLGDWFGPVAGDWHHLPSCRIPYALPQQFPPALHVPERPVRWQPGVYVGGDHRDNASIQGAMVSGRRAADALVDDLS